MFKVKERVGQIEFLGIPEFLVSVTRRRRRRGTHSCSDDHVGRVGNLPHFTMHFIHIARARAAGMLGRGSDCCQCAGAAARDLAHVSDPADGARQLALAPTTKATVH